MMARRSSRPVQRSKKVRSPRTKGRWEGLGVGTVLGLLLRGRLGWVGWLVLGLPVLLAARLYVLATQNPGLAFLVVLTVVLAVVLIGRPAWAARGLPKGWRRGLTTSGWLPRTRGRAGAFVYVLREWRDPDDCLLTEAEVEAGAPALLHLVYIGKTVDLAARWAQHAEEKPWWHDGLVKEVLEFTGEGAALAEEARRIRRAGRKSVPLHLRPRENRAMNPTYDPKRSAYMLQRALVKRVAA